jgi:hypothetical protein
MNNLGFCFSCNVEESGSETEANGGKGDQIKRKHKANARKVQER